MNLEEIESSLMQIKFENRTIKKSRNIHHAIFGGYFTFSGNHCNLCRFIEENFILSFHKSSFTNILKKEKITIEGDFFSS